MDEQKNQVKAFWNEAACGEKLYLKTNDIPGYQSQMELRYQLEPFIEEFACFNDVCGKEVLEIGVGLGADHQRLAEGGAKLFGIDLTERAVDHTRRRLSLFGLKSTLQVGDAELLPFDDESFDFVYSWGVLHHSPNTARAVEEVHRVLRPGASARIMIYHKYSLVGYMLWLRYGLLRGRPWRNLSDIYSSHMESPGTKAYSIREARSLFRRFSTVRITTALTPGDLLESDAGQRHRGLLLSVAKRVWPRRVLRRAMPGHGLLMMIDAVK